MEEFHVMQSKSTKSIWAGLDVYECSVKPTTMTEKASYKKIFSFVPPSSGMFLWVWPAPLSCDRIPSSCSC